MLKNTWKEREFTRGDYQSNHGWGVTRWHDERHNFYDCEYLGDTRKTFRNFDHAIKWADEQPGQITLL